MVANVTYAPSLLQYNQLVYARIDDLKVYSYGCTRGYIPPDFLLNRLDCVAFLSRCHHVAMQATRPKAYRYNYKRFSAADSTSIASLSCYKAVLCGHCSCMTGLWARPACSYIEALSLLVETNTQLQGPFSSTSLPCSCTVKMKLSMKCLHLYTHCKKW